MARIREGRISAPGSPGVGFLDGLDRHFRQVIGGQRSLAWAEQHLGRAIFRALAEQLGGEERDGRFEFDVPDLNGAGTAELVSLRQRLEEVADSVPRYADLRDTIRELALEVLRQHLEERRQTKVEESGMGQAQIAAQIAALQAALADVQLDLARLSAQVNALDSATAPSWDSQEEEVVVPIPSPQGGGKPAPLSGRAPRR